MLSKVSDAIHFSQTQKDALMAIKESNITELKKIVEKFPQITTTAFNNQSYLLHLAVLNAREDLSIFTFLLEKGQKKQLLEQDIKKRNVLDYAVLAIQLSIKRSLSITFTLLNYLLFEIKIALSHSNINMLKTISDTLLNDTIKAKNPEFYKNFAALMQVNNQDTNKAIMQRNIEFAQLKIPNLTILAGYACKNINNFFKKDFNRLPSEVGKKLMQLPDTLEEFIIKTQVTRTLNL